VCHFAPGVMGRRLSGRVLAASRALLHFWHKSLARQGLILCCCVRGGADPEPGEQADRVADPRGAAVWLVVLLLVCLRVERGPRTQRLLPRPRHLAGGEGQRAHCGRDEILLHSR
jgi:hypothetical protein